MPRSEDLFHGIQHTGTDVAVDHTDGAYSQGRKRGFARRHKNQPSIKTGLLFKLTAILRFFDELSHGGQRLKVSGFWKCCTAAAASKFRIL
jgi:hypothetical protein